MPAGPTSPLTVAQRVGRAMAERRQAMGKTQGQVAEALGVEQQTVSRWESGSRSPSLEMLDRLAMELDCTVVDFLKGGADRQAYHLLTIDTVLSQLNDAERALVVDHIQKFAELLVAQRR